MRVFFDSNIFVSALAFPGGRTDAALQRILDATDILLVSPLRHTVSLWDTTESVPLIGPLLQTHKRIRGAVARLN